MLVPFALAGYKLAYRMLLEGLGFVMGFSVAELVVGLVGRRRRVGFFLLLVGAAWIVGPIRPSPRLRLVAAIREFVPTLLLAADRRLVTLIFADQAVVAETEAAVYLVVAAKALADATARNSTSRRTWHLCTRPLGGRSPEVGRRSSAPPSSGRRVVPSSVLVPHFSSRAAYLASPRYHVGGRYHLWEVSMLESLERLVLLQIGAAAATRERVQEVVNRLIEQGRMEREEGRTVVNEVLGRARERSAGARTLVDASVQQGLRTAGMPNREAYEDLLFRVEQLEHRVRLLEDGPTAPTAADVRPETPMADPITTEPVTAPGVEPATPPVGGVDVAPRPPRDETDTPPGLQPGG